MNEFELIGESRTELGKGATRRLRRTGLVPAVLYGEGKDVVTLSLKANDVKKRMENEAFSSHILTVAVGKEKVQAVLKAVQRDPVSSVVSHLDLLRIRADHEITMHIPLHFLNEDICPGHKEGGVISHLVMEVEVSCLPKHLPEYLDVDLAEVQLGQTVHLSEIKTPEGVELTILAQEGDHDPGVVTVQLAKLVKEEDEEVEEDVEGADDVDGEEAAEQEGRDD